ncbi:MAG TPA: hypothetical protein VIT44_07030 [Cyclobacteriaceae bacterium]
MSVQKSIDIAGTVLVPTDKLWKLITDNNRVGIYFPFVKSSFSESIKTDTIRVSVDYWEGLFGTLRERCLVSEPMHRLLWRVEEDSRRVFRPDFIWGLRIETKNETQCILHFTASFETKNQMRSIIESFRLKLLFRKSLQAIQSALS